MQVRTGNISINNYKNSVKIPKQQTIEQPAQIPAQGIRIPAYVYRNRVNFGSTSFKEMYTELSNSDEGQKILEKLEQEQKKCLKAMLNVYIEAINKGFPDGRIINTKSDSQWGPHKEYTTDSLVEDLREGDLKHISAEELKKTIDEEFDRRYKPLLDKERDKYCAMVIKTAKSLGIEVTPEDLKRGFSTPVKFKELNHSETPKIDCVLDCNHPKRQQADYVFSYNENYNPESKPGTKTVSFYYDDHIHNVLLMDINYGSSDTLASRLSQIPVCKDASKIDTEIVSEDYGYTRYTVHGHKGFRLDHKSPTLDWTKLCESYGKLYRLDYIWRGSECGDIKEELTKLAYEKYLGKTPEQVATEKRIQEAKPAINNVLQLLDD